MPTPRVGVQAGAQARSNARGLGRTATSRSADAAFGTVRELAVSDDDATSRAGRPPCLGWLVERVAGAGSCSLGLECDALPWLDEYATYRALHPRLRAYWLDDYEQQQ